MTSACFTCFGCGFNGHGHVRVCRADTAAAEDGEEFRRLKEQIEEAEQRQVAAEKQFKRLHTVCITAQQV